MAGMLIFAFFVLLTYTVFVPVWTGESEHVKRGLVLLLLLGVLAFLSHLARMM